MCSHHLSRVFNHRALHAPRGFTPISDTPICLEIGAGKGKHAYQFAKDHPDQVLYAIERTSEKFHALNRLSLSSNLPNLRPVHADAIAWTVFAVYPRQIQTCFILYPNPEPKNKTQRFLNMPFFEFLLSRMAEGGQIVLASNISDYIDEAVQSLDDIWRLPFDKKVIDTQSKRTHFEIKYLARGELCQEIVITKPCGYRTRFDDVLPRGLKESDE